jgi:alkyldihydroxyacetonephosphate synthase
VVRPGSEEEVTAIIQAAVESDAVLIPFAGGSSISGSLEAPAGEERPRLG